MLDDLDAWLSGQMTTNALVRALMSHEAAVRASAKRGDRRPVAQAEASLKGGAGATFTFDQDGAARLVLAGRSWAAGRFSTPTLDELLQQAAAAERSSRTPARLSVLQGVAPALDIGALQAHGQRTLFQVASQWNCLEAPAPMIVDVFDYFMDHTQGPRASISAFPGTFLRHYAAPAPGGGRFRQTANGPQLNLLEGVCGDDAVVTNGYLLPERIADPAAFARTLEGRMGAIRVGVHDGVEVALGYDWDGLVDPTLPPRIAQVFTSTLAGQGRGLVEAVHGPICRQLLRAAYLGTLLAAVAVGRPRVVLTLIGGGAFKNPRPLIWESILWALDELDRVAPAGLHVLVNSRLDLLDLLNQDDITLQVQRRDGCVLDWRDGRPAPIR